MIPVIRLVQVLSRRQVEGDDVRVMATVAMDCGATMEYARRLESLVVAGDVSLMGTATMDFGATTDLVQLLSDLMHRKLHHLLEKCEPSRFRLRPQ